MFEFCGYRQVCVCPLWRPCLQRCMEGCFNVVYMCFFDFQENLCMFPVQDVFLRHTRFQRHCRDIFKYLFSHNTLLTKISHTPLSATMINLKVCSGTNQIPKPTLSFCRRLRALCIFWCFLFIFFYPDCRILCQHTQRQKGNNGYQWGWFMDLTFYMPR